MTLFHQPLFTRLVAKHAIPQPTPVAHKRLLHEWAAAIRDGSIRRQSESTLRGPFIQRFFVELLGYVPFGVDQEFTISNERRPGADPLIPQAWEYAMDTPDCQFVVVSNMLEIRLYAPNGQRLTSRPFTLKSNDTLSRLYRLSNATHGNDASTMTGRLLLI